MSIFDVLSGGNLGSVIDALSNKARSAATNIRENTPGGLGGLAGAGALGALLGNVLQGDLMKGLTMAGAGAVAWNFYKKWADSQKQATQEAGAAPGGWNAPQAHQEVPAGWGAPKQNVPPRAIDPTAELVMRAMIYAARADGTIDATEQDRMDKVLHAMLPDQDVSAAMSSIRQEPIDPSKIAAAVRSPEQAEDVYRLSCSIIDVDHFMEVSYLEALAKALGISSAQKTQLEAEAAQARRALVASVNG